MTTGVGFISTAWCSSRRATKRASVDCAEIVHRDDQRRVDLAEHRDHVVDIERVAAVDRDEHHVDPAQRVEVVLGQRVVEVAEMGDAEARHLENEDRVHVALELARLAKAAADIGGDVAEPDVVDGEVVVRRRAVLAQPGST